MPTNIIIIGANPLGLSVARSCHEQGIAVTVIDTKPNTSKEIWECRKLGCNVYTNTIITDIRHTQNGTIVHAMSANNKPRRYIASLVLQAPDTNESQLHSFVLETSHAVFPGHRWRNIRTITADEASAFKDKALKK